MTQYKVNKAYGALSRLTEFKMPVKKARALYTITKKAEEHFNFAVQEEKKYIAECNGKINDNGSVSFETPELFKEFQEKLMELNESEVDLDIQPLILTDADIGEQSISASDMYALEGFVSFE